jgi:hypothetical protein
MSSSSSGGSNSGSGSSSSSSSDILAQQPTAATGHEPYSHTPRQQATRQYCTAAQYCTVHPMYCTVLPPTETKVNCHLPTAPGATAPSALPAKPLQPPAPPRHNTG